MAPPTLQLDGITKRFAGVTALHGVTLALHGGRVHALVGENGAGKSTLVKIMTGAYQRDAGTMQLEGVPVTFRTPADAQAHGVIAVHQENRLLPHRTVAENIFLGREPRRWGFMHWRRLFDDAARLCETLHVAVDPRAVVERLPAGQRQMVAVSRAVSLGAKVLVLDEPTSSLTEREVQRLFTLVRTLADRGTALVYISHRMGELYALCDTVTVLRDGHHIATQPLAALDRATLVSLMLGTTTEPTARRASAAPQSATAQPGVPLLRATGLRRAPHVRDVSLDVRAGEIVGCAGLLGSGRSETARLLFGADAAESGTIVLHGATFTPTRPRDAIARGVGFVSEDRAVDGIIPELSVRDNLTLAALPALTRWGIVDRARQRTIVDGFMRRLGIKASSAEQRMRELSGGNQQKVLLARWLCTSLTLLLVDEPTRGIDLGARADVHRVIRDLAAQGLGVLMISSDLEEVVDQSTRVVVLRDGATAAVLESDAIASDAIVRAMAMDDRTVPAERMMTDGTTSEPHV